MAVDTRGLVELVIPTYHRPKALAQAVDSALAETPFLVTVLDDYSPEAAEESLDVAALNANFDGRLRVIRNAANLGASLNILHSLDVSRAPYTWAFTDDHVVPRRAGEEIVAIRTPELRSSYCCGTRGSHQVRCSISLAFPTSSS